jgi:hypothetical protein
MLTHRNLALFFILLANAKITVFDKVKDLFDFNHNLKEQKITNFFYVLINFERFFKFFCFEFANLSDMWGLLHEFDHKDFRNDSFKADWLLG